MSDLGPLIFEPIYRPKVWGARNLARLYGKTLPGDGPIGESWELADLDEGCSVVARGPLKGRTLRQLVADFGTALIGRASLHEGRFPLLVKFLDAREPLSIQVHPDDETAAAIGAGARSKDEMFHVVAAEPHGCIYLGLRPGVSREQLAAAARTGEVEPLMNRLPVRPGDSFHVPPGTLHALGAGVVVAEVETPSNTTYRLFDWGRTRAGGDAGLHVDLALRSIRALEAPPPTPRSHVGGLFTTVTRIVRTPAFQVEHVRFSEGMDQEAPYSEMVVWVVLRGGGQIASSDVALDFAAGDVVLLPAALKQPRVRTQADSAWLEVTVPAPSDLAAYDRPTSESLRTRDGMPAAPLGVNVRVRPTDKPR